MDQFHSENGIFQYAQLPIGITKEEATKRLGVEDLGPAIAGIGDVATYSPANQVTYNGQQVAVLLDFQGEELTMVQLNFLSHEEDTLAPIHEELTQKLYDLYGIYSNSQRERPPYYFETSNWDTHLDGDLTRLTLLFNRVEQDDTVVANLSLAVGKMVYANETE